MYSNFGGLHATFQEAGEVYGNVIEKFMRNVKLEFQSYGVKDGVRRELQELWREKLVRQGTVSLPLENADKAMINASFGTGKPAYRPSQPPMNMLSSQIQLTAPPPVTMPRQPAMPKTVPYTDQRGCHTDFGPLPTDRSHAPTTQPLAADIAGTQAQMRYQSSFAVQEPQAQVIKPSSYQQHRQGVQPATITQLDGPSSPIVDKPKKKLSAFRLAASKEVGPILSALCLEEDPHLEDYAVPSGPADGPEGTHPPQAGDEFFGFVDEEQLDFQSTEEAFATPSTAPTITTATPPTSTTFTAVTPQQAAFGQGYGTALSSQVSTPSSTAPHTAPTTNLGYPSSFQAMRTQTAGHVTPGQINTVTPPPPTKAVASMDDDGLSDISGSDSDDEENYFSHIICLYEKVVRQKNKFKALFREGVVQHQQGPQTREYVFNKISTDFEW